MLLFFLIKSSIDFSNCILSIKTSTISQLRIDNIIIGQKIFRFIRPSYPFYPAWFYQFLLLNKNTQKKQIENSIIN